MLFRTLIALVVVTSTLGAQQSKSTRGFFMNNGTKLYYEVAGEGAPVVLIHGGWLNSSQWDEQFPILTRKYRVLRYDMRGYGRSVLGQPDSAYTQYEDLAALLHHVGMERPHIVGVSAGAQAAIDFALNYPHAVGSLLLGASPLAGFDMGKEFTEGMTGVVTAGAADDLQLLHDRVWAFAPFRVAAMMPEVRRRLDEMIVRQNTWAGQRPGAPRPKRPQTPAAARLNEIMAPTLVVVGDGEMAALRNEADLLARSIRGARMVVIKGAGHFPNLEQPNRFNEIVLDWLETQAARTR
jgi:pimeloyl-ACP methyl ester carboxylesterase